MSERPAFVVRPIQNPPSRIAITSATGAGLLAMGGLWTLRDHGLIRVVAIGATIIVMGVLVAFERLGRTRLRFTLTDGRLAFNSRLGERQPFDGSQPSNALELRVTWFGKGTAPLTVWALLDAEGRAKVSVNAAAFHKEDLDELERRLGVEREVTESTVPAHLAREQFPGVIPWWLAHAVGLFWAAFAALAVVFAIVSSS